MGERLTGLYRSLDSIIGTQSSTTKLLSEHDLIVSYAKKILIDLNDTNLVLSQETKEKNKLVKGHLELNTIKSDLLEQKEKLMRSVKEKFSSMQKDLTSAIEEREFIKSKHDELEKKFIDITEEFKKYRAKMRLKYLSVNEKEEKFCKNCQKTFLEQENYNWSCRVHASKLSGDTYWCCGKSGKDSIGCIVAKHVSKEDNIADEEESNTFSSKFCSVKHI